MSLFNNTTIRCIPAVQRSNKLNCNVTGVEAHKILSCSWSTVIQISLTTNNTTPPPSHLTEQGISDIVMYYFKHSDQWEKLHIYSSWFETVRTEWHAVKVSQKQIYVRTDSCTLGNNMSDDRFRGFCSNRALKWKHIQHRNEFYQPLNGLAMGSPISSLVAELFLLHFEHLVITLNIDNKSIISESRYSADTLITYGNITIIFTILKELTIPT